MYFAVLKNRILTLLSSPQPGGLTQVKLFREGDTILVTETGTMK